MMSYDQHDSHHQEHDHTSQDVEGNAHEQVHEAEYQAAASPEQGEDEGHAHDQQEEDVNGDDPHKQCNARIQQLEEQLAYLSSDFTNYRRNIEKEKTRWTQEAQASILKDLLSVVDDVDRAIADLESQELSDEVAKRLEGIRLIYKSLHKLLESYDVYEITQVETFDPQWHEAVMQVSETDVPSGNIVSVIQKGYTFKGELLRTTKVSVAA